MAVRGTSELVPQAYSNLADEHTLENAFVAEDFCNIPPGDYTQGVPYGDVRIIDMSDEEILGLYEDEIKKDENTFAGITLSDEIKAELIVGILYGSKGYFVQKSHAEAGKAGKPKVSQAWSDASHSKAINQAEGIMPLLRDTLLAHGIPAENHEKKADEVIAAVRKVHSNTKNRSYHTKEMERLRGVRASMGGVALRSMVAN